MYCRVTTFIFNMSDSLTVSICSTLHYFALFDPHLPLFSSLSPQVKTDGGAFMVAFGSAANAISFACQIQVDLLDASYPASFLEAARTDASLKKDLGEVALRKVSHELHVASDGTTSTAELGEDISGVQVEAGMSEKEGLEANGAAVSGTEGSGGVDSEAKKSTWLWRGVRVRVGCFTGDPEVSRKKRRAIIETSTTSSTCLAFIFLPNLVSILLASCLHTRIFTTGGTRRNHRPRRLLRQCCECGDHMYSGMTWRRQNRMTLLIN